MVAPFFTLRFFRRVNLVFAAVATGLNACSGPAPPAPEPFFMCTPARVGPMADTGLDQNGLLAVFVVFLQAPLVQVMVTLAPFVMPCAVSDVTRSGGRFQKRSASPCTLGGRFISSVSCIGPPAAGLAAEGVPPTCTAYHSFGKTRPLAFSSTPARSS